MGPLLAVAASLMKRMAIEAEIQKVILTMSTSMPMPATRTSAGTSATWFMSHACVPWGRPVAVGVTGRKLTIARAHLAAAMSPKPGNTPSAWNTSMTANRSIAFVTMVIDATIWKGTGELEDFFTYGG